GRWSKPRKACGCADRPSGSRKFSNRGNQSAALALAWQICQSPAFRWRPQGALVPLMNGSELAQTRKPRLADRITRALGPAGVFFQGFLEHPKMVGSIIPSSRSTIDKMLGPVKWDECKLFVKYSPGVSHFRRP